MTENQRIDVWLWAVRVFKTRSMATDACRNRKVLIAGKAIKPSRNVRIGETIEVRQTGIIRRFKVKEHLKKRVSAKLASRYVEETTPLEEIEKWKQTRLSASGIRPRGSGRPTKRERRLLEKLIGRNWSRRRPS
jgi:ribosome-associated heat shock protein Hsp15